MNNSPLVGLINNIALLLAIALLFDLVIFFRDMHNRKIYQYVMGLFTGAIGIFLMLNPWVFSDGIIFDTRSILLSISGLFFGLIPTALAMLMTAAFRIYQGGQATLTGVMVILFSGTLGLLWRYRRKRNLYQIQPHQLYIFGLIVHIGMLAWMFLLPWETAINVVRQIGPGVMIFYPIATTLLGMLMRNRLTRFKVTEDLRTSELRLQSLVEILQHPISHSKPLLELALEKVISMSDSQVGFIFTYDAVSENLTLHSWSQSVMAECRLDNQNKVTALAESGLWGEAIRIKKPFILNDYSKTHEHKLGIPNGHLEIQRFMSVPIHSGDEIVAVVGLANKAEPYLHNDATQLSVVMNTAWMASERQRVQNELYESKERYETVVDHLPKSLVVILDREFRCQFIAGSEQYRFSANPDSLLGKPLEEIIAPDRAAVMKHQFANVLAGEVIQVEEELLGEFYNTLSAPLKDSSGQVTNILVLSTNISERRQIEKELKRLLTLADQSRLALLSVIEDQKMAEEQIRRLNLELESRVEERTQQLAVANQELEAFSYSVSHDLRAPLRAMDGFSTALLSAYQSKLDEQGQHYLTRIQQASQRMGLLINDLLDLSRVSRVELVRKEVDLSQMAMEISDETMREFPETHFDVQIEPGLKDIADVNLIRVMLENLIANAMKFSSQREVPQIRIGQVTQEDEKIYFVRDNGVGFDMEYAHKLFSPFQRLHGVNEFPGTGIGLATVQRIIRRHGGRIWVEAQEGQGALFSFTLGGTR